MSFCYTRTALLRKKIAPHYNKSKDTKYAIQKNGELFLILNVLAQRKFIEFERNMIL